MVLNEIILFGNSPFINDVDVANLVCRYPSMACNSFGSRYIVDYLFLFDAVVQPACDATLTFIPNWFKDAPKHFIKYCPVTNQFPVTTYKKSKGYPVIGRKHFTSSTAINWAILNGFKKIYLVGVDHVETDKTFKHFDDTPSHNKLNPILHREFKQFVYECATHVEIFQTNPQVKTEWRLPFKRIEELYRVKAKQ
jgi:hypothetical protein